jgi:signal transduction histidine kinase/CheY-like chemotaxis protein
LSSAVGGAYALIGGAVTLVGWFLGARGLVAWAGQGINMKANTAVCAMVGGLAILALALDAPRWLVRALAAVVGLIGALTVFEHLSGINLGIDTVLFDEPAGARATTAPGRMGPPASLSFSVLATGLWLATGGARARRAASALALVPIVIALLGIVGYLYGVSELYAVARLSGVALQTATMIAALGLSLVLAVPEHGFAGAIRRDDPGGLMFRRLLAPLLLLPLLIGWTRLRGERLGLYDTAFGTAFRTLFEMVLFALVLWWTAQGVSRQARAARRAEQALREADRRKDEFLATLAHELRNPLAPLRSALETVRRNPAMARQGHATMERQLGQMVHLVDDLLDVSRISRGRMDVRREPVDLAVVIDSAIETCRPVIDGRRHRLSVSLPAERLFVRGDTTRLAQVVGNLLDNAAKYTEPGGGRIVVELERQGDEAVLRVRDNGVGIATEMLPRVFDMFTRVGTPAADWAPAGLGIGLALVKQILELHGGQIVAASPPPGEPAGRGSEFCARLPLIEAPAEAPAPPLAASAPAPVAALRVLIADDNADAADSLAGLFETMGHQTRTARDGTQALAAVTEWRPHVAFLDIGMPGISGHEVCKRIRAQRWGGGVVLVALTGWGQAEDRRQSLVAGFDHHLVKPAKLEALEEILLHAAAGRPARAEESSSPVRP